MLLAWPVCKQHELHRARSEKSTVQLMRDQQWTCSDTGRDLPESFYPVPTTKNRQDLCLEIPNCSLFRKDISAESPRSYHLGNGERK